MGRVAMNDLIVDSKGLCFFCLDPIIDNIDTSQCSSSSPDQSQPSIHSLRWLSRYLKVDIRKVLHEKVITTSHQLLDKVDKSKLKAELCADCHNLNEQLTRRSLQMEKIEMEVATYLECLSTKLEHVVRDYSGSDSATSLEALYDKRKFEIMEMLRKEAKVKCGHKLSCILPRICLQKLSMKEVNQKILKTQRQRIKGISTAASSDNEKIDESHIKQESSLLNSSPENDGNSDFDDSMGALLSPVTDIEYEFDKDQDRQDDERQEGNGGSSKNNKYQIITPDEESPTMAKIADGTIIKHCIVNSESGRHKCKKCFKEYSAYIGFYLHYRSEHLKIRHSCSTCGHIFKQVSNLNTHQKNCHKGVKYKCQGCNQFFELESKLSTHDCDAELRQTKLYKCAQCSRQFTTRQACDRHRKHVHEGVRYKCRKCSQVFGWKASWWSHIRVDCLQKKSTVKVCKCLVCGKVCTSRQGLDSHMRGFHGTQTYKCDLCNRNFSTKCGRTIHRLSAHKSQP